MSPEEIQKLKALLVATAMYYGQQIPDQVLGLYVEDLADLPFDRVAQAMGEYRRDAKSTRAPLPGMIRARVEPKSDPEQEAAIMANQIVEAIARTGPYQTPQLDPVAMRIIQMEGGWMQICEMVTNDNLTAFKAQWRTLAKALIGKRERNEALALPSPATRDALRIGGLTRLFHDMPKADA
jgi:hypothetical protein